jgi:hypothetical protein
MIAANHVYNLTKPDGLTLGAIGGALYYAQLTGRGEVEFDRGEIYLDRNRRSQRNVSLYALRCSLQDA